jgi:hypothetical protein
MKRKVLKYTLPVDDQWHKINMPLSRKDVLFVGCQFESGTVEFWVEVHENEVDSPERHARTFRIYGTGFPIPEGVVHRGTTFGSAKRHVWHLYEDMKA